MISMTLEQYKECVNIILMDGFQMSLNQEFSIEESLKRTNDTLIDFIRNVRIIEDVLPKTSWVERFK